VTVPVPDTKDWTWVLERACPECGFDTRTITGPDVAAWVDRLAREWRDQLVAGTDVAVRTEDDRWSVLEYGCHVRDVFALAHTRSSLMLTQDDPTFENWDQDETAIEADYAHQDPHRVADELEQAARGFAEILEKVPESGWPRPGRRSDGARFTVETFARYIVHDPMHHLWDVRQP
jgi:hypothetical protein